MLESFCCGPYQTNVYLLKNQDPKVAVIIDAAPDSFQRVAAALNGYEVHLFLTHGHWDHIADAHLFQKKLSAKIYFPDLDRLWLKSEHQTFIIPLGYTFETFKPDIYLKGGETFDWGNISLQILHIPGHTQGHVGILDTKHKAIFVGDTLFAKGRVGRTDLMGGNLSKLKESLKTLSHLPENFTAYPGHGTSTVTGGQKPVMD